MKRNVFLHLGVLLVTCLLMPATVHALGDAERVFYSYDASDGLADNSAQSILCTKTGRMLISTIGHINFYDGDTFVHIDPEEENVFPLPKYKGHYHLYFDKHHHLWVKDQHQVTCVDLMMERFVTNVGDIFKELGMKEPVEDLFADINNHLWLLSGKKLYGLDDKTEISVRHNSELQDVDIYNNRLLLEFFANGTVSALDVKTGSHLFDVSAFNNNDTLRFSNSSVILPDSNLYYQIRNGDRESVLLRLDIEKRQWVQLMALPYHLNNMVLRNGVLYIASEYGYWMYDVTTGEKQHVDAIKMSRFRSLQTDINTIAFDRQGGMWLGTEKRGILYSRPFRSAFVNYNWSQPEALAYEALLTRTLTDLPTLPRHVNCQYRDSRGWLWTGLYTGLQLERPDRKDIRIYTDEDGLRNEMIHSVIEDDNHDIWVGTSFGISHLMIADGEVVNIDTYTQRDNVPNESFVNARAMKQPDGTIIMQSLDHIVVFNPKNINRDSLVNMTLAPKLVRLMVNGQHMEPGMKLGDKVILDRAISRIWEVSVDYNQNTLSMIFSGLNFARPIQTYYRVRVQGLYDDWHIYSYMNAKDKVDEKGLLHLHLPALKPGKYVVEIQVSSSPDRFELRPYTWVIYVNEPWWRSTGIYLLLGLIVCLLAAANVIYYNYNTRLDMMRNNKEGDIMRRIRNYVTRCDELHNEPLLPSIATTEEESVDALQQNNRLFINTMMTIVPFIHSHANEKITMAMLSEHTGMEVTKLFELLSSNFYLSPRQMVGRLRLQEASELLLTTDKSVEEIANELMFVTPNYFISSFYHHFRQTPKDYRKSKAL